MRRRLGLRARSTVAFAVAALVLAVVLSLITYFGTRSYLMSERDAVVLRQSFLNARLVRDTLAAEETTDMLALVESLTLESGSFALIERGSRWFPSSASVNEDTIPRSVREAVSRGQAGRQRFALGDTTAVAVGVHIPSIPVNYYEISSYSDLERSLNALRTTLTVGSLVVTVVGAAIGRWASRRVLQPLTRVATAASALAEGGLDTRLQPEADRDLAVLVARFNEMAETLQDRIERDARFASDVSHELRTPLTAITAAVDVLQTRRDELSDRGKQALDVLVAQVRRFDRMIVDLLEVSRFDARSAELNCEEVDVGTLVERMVRSLGYEDLPVVVRRGGMGTAMIDKRRLERVLANLLDNATIHGGGPVQVEVDGNALEVRIAVEDAGPGIAPEERTRVFERFARGAASRHRIGTGLGLSLVAEHAKLHGGRVVAADRPGGGARMVVILPRATS